VLTTEQIALLQSYTPDSLHTGGALTAAYVWPFRNSTVATGRADYVGGFTLDQGTAPTYEGTLNPATTAYSGASGVAKQASYYSMLRSA
jgi:hypothetical protein